MLRMRFLIPESWHNLASQTAEASQSNVPLKRDERHLFKDRERGEHFGTAAVEAGSPAARHESREEMEPAR